MPLQSAPDMAVLLMQAFGADRHLDRHQCWPLGASARQRRCSATHHRAHGCRATGQAAAERLQELDALRSAGAISEAEHAAKRGQIIDEI